MKNLLIGIAVGIIVGIGIGYKLFTPTGDEELKSILASEKLQPLIAAAPARPVSALEAQNAIKEFYTLASNDKDSLLKLMACSYELDYGSILKIIQSLGPLGTGVNVTDCSIRMYPSIWNKNEGKKYSLVFVGEKPNDETALNDGLNDDNEIFEYIGPCPKDCPKEFRTVDGKNIQNDIFKDEKWDEMLNSINAPIITPRK